MILEKVSGVQLSYSLTGIKDVRDKVNDVVKVLSQMHDITKKFTELRFSMLGSLFYREDVAGYPHTTTIFADESEANDLTKKFAIGPHMSYYLWRDERKEMDVDRGPCELSRSITLNNSLRHLAYREHCFGLCDRLHPLRAGMASALREASPT